jgi:Tfp pilus assembly protein PilE
MHLMPRQSGRKRQAGLTLVELLLVMVMTVFLASAITFAYSSMVTMQRRHNADRGKGDETGAMEREVTRLLRGARISSVTTDTTSYFQGVSDSGGSDLGCDRVTFTTTEPAAPMAAMNSTDDFDTQQSARGPVGGLAEVSLGTTPIGNAGDKAGLFRRVQRPADGDTTQGGMESLVDPNISSVGFQFYDGTQWVTSWDTTTGSRRLPAAVQVSYKLKDDDSNTIHVFVAPIPCSDVTSSNPYTASTTATTTQ